MPALVCDLAFVYWNRIERRYCPLPDGVEVLVRDADPLSPDDTLGEGWTLGGQGRVHIEVDDRDERRPEIYFEIRFGRALIDLTTGELWSVLAPSGEVLLLPEVWSSRNRYTVDYQRGLWKHFGGTHLGTPQRPIEFRLTFDAFVRFVRWDEDAGDFVGLPQGTPVRLLEHDPLEGTVLAVGTLDDHGRALLSTAEEHEHRPDLSLELELPQGTWNSTAYFARGSLSQRGFWRDHVGTRIGRWGSPYTFDVGEPQPRRVRGNQARPLIDGPAIFEAMRRGIEQARRSIHVEVMLLFADEYGEKIRDLLVARAAAGVEVRLLYDVNTTATSYRLSTLKEIWTRVARRLEPPTREAMLARLEAEREVERARGQTAALVEPLAALPHAQVLDSSFPYVQVAPSPAEGEPPAYRQLHEQLPFFAVARIDHRKLMVFDGRWALMGGANIGREYIHEEPFDPRVPAQDQPHAKWHDCYVELRGPVVRLLQDRFRERWVAEGGDAFDRGASWGSTATDEHPYYPPLEAEPGGVPVSILDTTPGARLHVHDQLLALLSEARTRILVENPYFCSPEVMHRLTEAAGRGVRVVCIFPDHHNDSWEFLYAMRLRYPALLEAGVEVYEYGGRMTHAKVAVIDDETLIGSANLNHASLFNHYELVAVLHDPSTTADFVRDFFERDLQQARKIEPDDVEGLLDIHDWVRPYLRWVVDVWF